MFLPNGSPAGRATDHPAATKSTAGGHAPPRPLCHVPVEYFCISVGSSIPTVPPHGSSKWITDASPPLEVGWYGTYLVVFFFVPHVPCSSAAARFSSVRSVRTRPMANFRGFCSHPPYQFCPFLSSAHSNRFLVPHVPHARSDSRFLEYFSLVGFAGSARFATYPYLPHPSFWRIRSFSSSFYSKSSGSSSSKNGGSSSKSGGGSSNKRGSGTSSGRNSNCNRDGNSNGKSERQTTTTTMP
mmetsp:Transcript_16962/g.33868  ORF Transcript_16962/g.33868 Transcript_16962/m.33868 type:complete len:241 (-) Transcript_16962:454-1176(-)